MVNNKAGRDYLVLKMVFKSVSFYIVVKVYNLSGNSRCLGQGYSCQPFFNSSSCIQTSECVGDGTCRFKMRLNGTICRAAVDICDQPERYVE